MELQSDPHRSPLSMPMRSLSLLVRPWLFVVAGFGVVFPIYLSVFEWCSHIRTLLIIIISVDKVMCDSRLFSNVKISCVWESKYFFLTST